MTTADTSATEAALVARGDAGLVPDAPREKTFGEWARDNKEAMSQMLKPAGLDIERFGRALMMVYRRTPKMAMCTLDSVQGAALRCAYYGLEPGPLGHAWLIPFKRRQKVGNSWTEIYEVQFILGYKGMLELFRRADVDLEVREVYEGDTFDYGYGLDPFLTHKPCPPSDRGQVPTRDGKGMRDHVVAYYGVARQVDTGQKFFQVVYPDEIELHRLRSAAVKAGMPSPWDSDPLAMEKKTVVRIMDPWVAKSVQVQEAMLEDEHVLRNRGNVIDVEEMPAMLPEAPEAPLDGAVSDETPDGEETPPVEYGPGEEPF